jgi:hypothetical protein
MSHQNAILARTKALLALCAKQDYTQAAPFFLYRGENAAERWQRPVNVAVPEEEKFVKDMVNRIYGWLQRDAKPALGEYNTTTNTVGEWHAQQVIFGASTPDPLSRDFGYLYIGGDYRIGDIDK